MEMSRFTLPSDEHVTALRRRIATGDYAVNASNVANSIVRKLKDINRARRVLADATDDRSPEVADETRQPPES
jgi:hypothetical protein